jgi:hypothetical protein
MNLDSDLEEPRDARGRYVRQSLVRPPWQVRKRNEALKADYQQLRDSMQAASDEAAAPSPEPEVKEELDRHGFLTGEEQAALQDMSEKLSERDEMVERLRDRRGVGYGPRPHLVRGGDGGFVEIPPTRFEWKAWAEKMEHEEELADYPDKPESRESFHEKYRREYQRRHAAIKANTEPFDKEGKTLPRPRDAAKLETPPKDPTPEQVSALRRLAKRVEKQCKDQSAQARAQRRDSRGRFA